jgi:hypothetical protein
VLLEVEGMIEPGFENRRGRAVIFGRAEDHDRISRRGFVSRRLLADGDVERPLRVGESQRRQQQDAQNAMTNT